METKESILVAAISVFGRYGFKRTSVEQIAAAAQLSKQGLYLHFGSKQEIFVAAFKKYLDDGIELVQAKLTEPNSSLYDRLFGAMDVWFGRHISTFAPESFDIIEASRNLSGNMVDGYKDSLRNKIAKALADSAEFKKAKNVASPKEVSQVLCICGQAWKESHTSRSDFMKKMGTSIRVCCQIES